MIEELRREAKVYRRHEAALAKSRKRMATLLQQARAEQHKPADLARELDHLYTPDHISRIAPPPADGKA